MLDIDSSINVDTGSQKFFYILIPPLMARTRHITVRQFINDYQLRAASENSIQIHFLQHLAMIFYFLLGDTR